MRLALAAGRLDVDAVLAELSSWDIAEWQAFERIEGHFGERGAWERAAMLASLYAESHRDTKKRARPFTAADFVPWISRPKMTPRAFRAQLAHLVQKPKKR